MDYSLCEMDLRQLKEIAKKRKIPITKKTKCELILLLERDGYTAPSKRTRFQKQQDRIEYESDDIDDKLKYNLCLKRRNKYYLLSNDELKQKIKKRNPNFIIPSNLSQQKLIDELMYLDECNDLLPNNFNSKLEFIPEKIYMKPITKGAVLPYNPTNDKNIKKMRAKRPTDTKQNWFWDNKMKQLELERMPIKDLLNILYERQYYPMQLISKLKTREQLINAIMMRESDVLKMISKL